MAAYYRVFSGIIILIINGNYHLSILFTIDSLKKKKKEKTIHSKTLFTIPVDLKSTYYYYYYYYYYNQKSNSFIYNKANYKILFTINFT